MFSLIIISFLLMSLSLVPIAIFYKRKKYCKACGVKEHIEKINNIVKK